MKNMYIKLKQNINKEDYAAINNLKDICFMNDKTSLKLELDYKLNQEDIYDLTEINEFMYYNDNQLIGYLGICQFNSDTIEVNGMVHPNHRRKKIFTKLYSLVLEEFSKRETKNMLLLCDKKSKSGLEFIKSTKANYDSSEYEMFHNKGKLEKPFNVKLRKATKLDSVEIAKQNAIYFGSSELDLSNPEDGEMFGRYAYIALIDNSIIGKVHIKVNEKSGYIYGLGVLHEFRNKGYGKQILKLTVNILREYNVDDIILQVLVNNEHALKLYLSCGFEVVSTTEYYKIQKSEI